MAVAPVRIPTFTREDLRVDEARYLPPVAIRRLNDSFEAIAYALNQLLAIPEIQSALVDLDAATAAAQSAADNANAAADSSRSESSLVNSFVTNPDNPISADNAGNVTISTHDRQYGDTTLNPTVSVNGGVLATAATSGQVVRVYYDDPTRAGGPVSYQFTVDPASPPVQGGDRHSVGVVTIPAVGSQDGSGLKPPGYVLDTP